MPKLLRTETYDRIIIREDGKLREVDCNITPDGRVLLNRNMDPRNLDKVQDYLQTSYGMSLVPVFDGALSSDAAL